MSPSAVEPADFFGALSNKICGTNKCDLYQYCNKYRTECDDCFKICDPKGHDFEQTTCKEYCQEFLLDSRYINLKKYSDDIKYLKNQQTVILIILIILVIFVFLTNGVRIIRYIKNHDFSLFKKFLSRKEPEKPKEPVTHANPLTQSPRLRPKVNTNVHHGNNPNRTSSVFSVTGTEIDQHTVSTPISTRYPAEDSTLDYAYVNKALAVTPTNGQPPIGSETTF